MSLIFVHTSALNIKDLEKRTFKDGEMVFCEPFIVVHNGSYLEFRMILSPNGVIDYGRKTAGVWMSLESRNAGKLKCSFKRTVQKSSRCYPWVSDRSFEENIKVDWPSSIAENLAELEKNKLLVDGHLRMSAEIKLDASYFDWEKEFESKMESLSCKNIGFFSEVYAKMSSGETTNHTDYNIVCKGFGQKKFPCHKLIIRERSRYFENLFASHANFEQQESHEVGWSPEVAEEVLFFIYNDRESPKFSIAPLYQLIEVAGMLEMDKLLLQCQKRLIENMDRNNAWDFLRIADAHEMKFLKSQALCIVTEDPSLADRLAQEKEKKGLWKEVVEFCQKRGRAQMLIQ